MAKKLRGTTTDTSTMKSFKSPYNRKLSTRAVKKIQSGVRALRKYIK